MIDDEFAPIFVNVESIGQKVENLFDFCKFGFEFGNRKPSPFLSSGRVQMFQNSEIFCKVIKSVSPRLRILSTAALASV